MLMLRMAEPGTRPPGTCSDFVKTLIKAARLRNTFSVPRKKLTCSGHAANSRRYRDLGSTSGLRRRRGAPVNKKSRKACSGADDGPWRQSGVLKEPRVQLVRGLIRTKPMNDLGADGAPQA